MDKKILKITKFKHLYNYLLLCCVALFTTAAQATAEDLLLTMLNETETYKANFVKQVYNEKGTMVHSSHGKVTWQHPDKFYFHTTSPQRKLIVDEGELLVYEKNSEPVSVTPLRSAYDDFPALVLMGDKDILGDVYTIHMLPQEGNQTHFLLRANREDMCATQVELFFEGRSLQKMYVFGREGYTSRIKFNK